MIFHEFFDRRLSAVAFGCDRITTADAPLTAEFLDTYVSYGGNFLDTARIYGFGDCEAALGAWLVRGGNRKKVFLGTKGGHPDLSDMHKGRLDFASLQYDICKSLEALKTDHVDMYYLHRDDRTLDVAVIVETLNAFIGRGYTRYIGVSNWRQDRIEAANAYATAHSLTPFTADQVQFSLAKQVVCDDDTLVIMDKPLYEFHKRTDMACVCYSSQAKGYFSKLQNGQPLSGLASRWFDCEENRQILKKLSPDTATAAALFYLIEQPFPTYAIIGASTPGQLVSSLQSLDMRLGFDAVKLREI
ncbi:MAG: aldo/keto reductase [Clostridia bacterium]|nr:aldo/keto reductase [Clostridia bacterium]